MSIKDNKDPQLLSFYMRTIYFLALEHSKYFFFATESTTTSECYPVQIFLESVLSYDYLQKYKPTYIINKWPETHPIDLDTYVKKFMLLYGIDNVRGGSYSSIELTPEQISFLKTELYGPKEPFPQEVINNSIQKYAKGVYSNKELKKEKAQLELNYTKYKNEKENLEYLKKLDIPQIKNSIEWLKNICEIQRTRFSLRQTQTPIYRIQQQEIYEEYHKAITAINKTYEAFITYSKTLPKIDTDLSIKNPEFLFDDYIFHGHRVHLPIYLDRVNRLCCVYEYFLTFLENRLKEYEFDFSSWGDYPEETFTRSLVLIDLCTM
jgi:hypothetical protein